MIHRNRLIGGVNMLEKIDLKKKMSRERYEELIEPLAIRLGHLQRECKEKEIPIMIVFEGWGASGKGTQINRLIGPLDPRGFKVYTTAEPTEDESLHPFLWRFWTKTPAKGKIHIFDRSWYQRVCADRLEGITGKKELQYAFNELTEFEELLSNEGTMIIKFFLHISKKEQAKRFKELEKSKKTSWRVTKRDWRHNNLYEEELVMYDEMIAKTDSGFAPWNIIEAMDKEYAAIKIISTVIKQMEAAIKKKEKVEAEREIEKTSEETAKEETFLHQEEIRSGVLASVDLSKTITKAEYKKRLRELQKRLSLLHNEVYLERLPVVLAFEGWDAAGKGGTIKRLTECLDPRGYEVIPISAPNDIERAHHYLWRFWQKLPKDGHIAIFDRTWYGRVLVERIEGFCKPSQWKRGYSEINRMEEHLTNSGGIVLKFWLHVDKDEQERRFKARQENPEKQWKITDEDWRNREKWDQYEEAVDEMIIRTSTKNAPWIVVEANNKMYARIKVLETVIDAIEKKLK